MTRETSIETYRQIEAEGLLTPLRFRVYQALYRHGPCTANELVKAMAEEGSKLKSRDYFAQRLPELRELGVVRENGKKICSVTGRKAISWIVTGNLPAKFEKPKRIKCQRCNGKGYFEEQQTRLF